MHQESIDLILFDLSILLKGIFFLNLHSFSSIKTQTEFYLIKRHNEYFIKHED